MSKSVATESNEGHKSREISRKRGAGDERNEDGEGLMEVPPAESLTILTVASTVPATTDLFMHTPEFRRHFVEFIPGDTLMTMRLATKGWKAAADAFIDEAVRSGVMIVHGGNDISYQEGQARNKRCKLATRVIFLLNITKVKIGDRVCYHAANLVVVDVPEGVVSIGRAAFMYCSRLTTVSFPTTLTSIGVGAFSDCYRLDNVDLLHTNPQELGDVAFAGCSELKSMTIPDSLQVLDYFDFDRCSKLVPSNIKTWDNNAVVAHLRSKQN